MSTSGLQVFRMCSMPMASSARASKHRLCVQFNHVSKYVHILLPYAPSQVLQERCSVNSFSLRAATRCR